MSCNVFSTERGPSCADLQHADIVTVRPVGEVMTRQRLPYFIGISGATAGARGLSLNLV